MNAPVQRSQHTASYYAASSLPQPDHPVLQGDVVADVPDIAHYGAGEFAVRASVAAAK